MEHAQSPQKPPQKTTAPTNMPCQYHAHQSHPQHQQKLHVRSCLEHIKALRNPKLWFHISIQYTSTLSAQHSYITYTKRCHKTSHTKTYRTKTSHQTRNKKIHIPTAVIYQPCRAPLHEECLKHHGHKEAL
jgi:hypothetical protein